MERALYVDTSGTNAQGWLLHKLNERGYASTSAQPDEAMRIIREGMDYDFLILEARRHEGDGVAAQIAELSKRLHPRTPVALITNDQRFFAGPHERPYDSRPEPYDRAFDRMRDCQVIEWLPRAREEVRARRCR